jgi:hypothetical protein
LSGIPADKLINKHLSEIRHRSLLFETKPFKAILEGQESPSFQPVAALPMM